MGFFSDKREAQLRICQKMVEAVVDGLGLDPAASRLEVEQDHIAWGLRHGSAAVYVFLRPGEQDTFLQVVSPVMKVPTGNLLTLFRRLLELNAQRLRGAAFGIKGDDIVLTLDRPTEDLDQGEIEWMIRRVGEYADELDDVLKSEFGPLEP